METALQLTTNGLIAGSAYALLALGFGIIYGTTQTFHFAHGAVYSLAGYVFYHLIVGVGAPFAVGAAVAIITATVLGVSIERAVYRPLRRIGASQLEILLSSLGLYVVIENLIIILWQSDPRVVPVAEALQRGTKVGLVWVTGLQGVVLTASLILWTALVLFLRQTKLGKAIRALAADPEMTEVVGINEERMRLLVFGVGSVLAGVAVVFAAIDTGIAPTAGMNALLVATIAVIVGGTSSISGWVAGGFLIGVAENVGIWKISSEWKQAIAFGVLVVFILLRPQGLFGPRWAR